MASSAVSLQLPRRLSSKEFICQCRRCGLDPWVRKVSWKRKCQLSPVFLPGEFHGQKSLVCCSLRGCKELDTTGQLGSHACMQLVPEIRFVRTKPTLVNPAGVWLQEAKLSLSLGAALWNPSQPWPGAMLSTLLQPMTEWCSGRGTPLRGCSPLMGDHLQHG